MATPFRTHLDLYISCIQGRATKTLAAARRSLHPRNPEFTALIRRLATGAALLIFSLVLGVTAHEQSTRDALKTWETQNPPSGELWVKLLKSQGFEEVPEGTRKNNLIRHHPGRWDQLGEVWATSASGPAASRWLALLVLEHQGQAAALRVFEYKGCSSSEVHRADTSQPRVDRPRRRKRKGSVRLVSSESRDAPTQTAHPLPGASDWHPLGIGWTAIKVWSESPGSSPAPADCSSRTLKNARQERISRRNSDPRAFTY
jgi:hypothetical protein